MVRGHEPSFDLADALVHYALGDVDGDSVFKEYPGLHVHYLVEVGHGAALGMVRYDEVYPLAPVS